MEAIGYHKMEPFVNLIPDLLQANHQRGTYVPFGDFFNRYLEKFDDEKLENKNDVVNVIWRAPLPEELKEDIYEPRALNIAYEYEDTTMNFMSQGTKTLTKYER